MRPSSRLSEDIEGDQEARLLKTLDEKIDGARKTSVLVFGVDLTFKRLVSKARTTRDKRHPAFDLERLWGRSRGTRQSRVADNAVDRVGRPAFPNKRSRPR
jgi:hypothetical protein